MAWLDINTALLVSLGGLLWYGLRVMRLLENLRESVSDKKDYHYLNELKVIETGIGHFLGVAILMVLLMYLGSEAEVSKVFREYDLSYETDGQ